MRDKLKRAMADLEAITGHNTRDFPTTLHDLLACMQEHTREITPPFVRDVKREAPQLFAVVEQGRREMITRHFGRLFAQGKRKGVCARTCRWSSSWKFFSPPPPPS